MLGGIFIFSIMFHQRRYIKSQREKLEAFEKSEQKLRESYAQLRKLSAHLQTVREEERTRIAREIHDELGQLLTVMKMDIALFQRKIRSLHTEGAIENATRDLKSMSDLADSTIKSVRRIATELRPEILDELGLKEAIEWELQRFEERTGTKSEFHTNISEITIGREPATALFRILQETLTNVVRHAQASQVSVNFEEKGSCLLLQVSDDGKGITEEEVRGEHSLGLLGMRERALIFGGDVVITGQPGRGTSVRVQFPMNVIAHSGESDYQIQFESGKGNTE